MSSKVSANPNRIAHLEHETDVVPVGSDPEHCQRCRCVSQSHYTVETSIIVGGRHSIRGQDYCSDCGAPIPREMSAWP